MPDGMSALGVLADVLREDLRRPLLTQTGIPDPNCYDWVPGHAPFLRKSLLDSLDARRAACVRLLTFSCRNILDTWSLMVLGERQERLGNLGVCLTFGQEAQDLQLPFAQAGLSQNPLGIDLSANYLKEL